MKVINGLETQALGWPGTGSKAAAADSAPKWYEGVPGYLLKNYWWAYVHPRAVRFWDRQWLVNWILFGNLVRLRDAALNAMGSRIAGKTLEVACVYGDFSVKLAECIAPGGSLDIVDVLPIQLRNLGRKLPAAAPVTLHQCDSTALEFADRSFDQVVVFFLLHEQPAGVREKSLREALRVVRPGGKLVLVDYHRPAAWNPMRYAFEPILRLLEPFAVDLWYNEVADWLPAGAAAVEICKRTYFGGLYQMLVMSLPPETPA